MDEQELVSRLIDGDRRAAREFVDRTRFAVMATLRRFRQLNRADVDDLFQDVFVRVFAQDCRVLRQWRGGSLEGYVRRIARNEAIDLLRARRRRPEDDPIEEVQVLADEVDDPEQQAVINQLRRMMLEAIQRLEPPDAEVIRLVDLEGLTYEEAANQLAITRNNLGVRLNRARRRLAQVVMQHFPALHAHLESIL